MKDKSALQKWCQPIADKKYARWPFNSQDVNKAASEIEEKLESENVLWYGLLVTVGKKAPQLVGDDGHVITVSSNHVISVMASN